MKKTLITVILALTAFPLMAQRVSVKSENLLDIGKVEFNSPAEGVFELVNDTDSPLTIDRVDTGCGCTKARFPQTIIAPGEKYSVSVSYDARTLGHFDRIIDVYANGSDTPMLLELRGHVVNGVTAYEEKAVAARASKTGRSAKDTQPLPEKIGELYADCNTIEFENVHIGDVLTYRFHIHNPIKETIHPQMMHLPGYVRASISPSKLRPNQTAEVTMTFDASDNFSASDVGLLQNDVYLGKNPGDKVGADKRIRINAVIVPPANIGEVDASAPKIAVSTNEILVRKKKATELITITNSGTTPLVISRIQPFTPGVYVELDNTTITPDQPARMKVTVKAKEYQGYGSLSRLLLVTNDPENPTLFINIRQAE